MSDTLPTPPPVPQADGLAYLREYVSGGHQAALAAVRQCLPQFIDDIQRDFGGDVYERMLHDDAVASSFSMYKLGILADDIRVEPAVSMPGAWEEADPEQVADAERAKELADFVQRCVEGMDGQPLLDVADDLLDALGFGHKVAEIVLKPGIGIDAGRLVLRAVKPKKRGMTAFVVNEYGDTVGLIGVDPHKANTLTATGIIIGDIPDLLPREKAVIVQHAVKNCDPRGTSILRAAYMPWFLKTQVLPEYFKFLKQFASPGVIGKTPEATGGGFVPQVNADGTPITNAQGVPQLISAEQALMNALLGWMNASVLVVKGGTEIDFLQSEGGGEAFLAACDYFDRQITRAILGTTRATMEAQHGSRADSGQAQDVVGLRIAFQKGRLAGALTRDLARVLIRVNFGDEALKLCPKFCLSKVEAHDWAKDLAAVSQSYASGFLHDSQLPALDARLGLPARDMEAMAREKAEASNARRLAAGDLNNATKPGVEDPEGGEDE